VLGERQKLRLALENCRVDPGRLGTPSLIWMSVCKQFLCPDQDQLSPFFHLCTACGCFALRQSQDLERRQHDQEADGKPSTHYAKCHLKEFGSV
jgi:hypothetical protein